MGDGIQQHLPVHHVDVQVLPALNGRFVVEVSVQQPDKVGFAHRLVLAQCLRHDGEGVGDPVFGIGERQLGDRG